MTNSEVESRDWFASPLYHDGQEALDVLEVASKRRSFQLSLLPCNEDHVTTNKVCGIGESP